MFEVIDPVYLVGGSVRDQLLHFPLHDLDFATPLLPDEVEQCLRAENLPVTMIGKEFGTITTELEGHRVEITTFRRDEYVQGSRHPRVTFITDLTQDLARRDFTINAMALQKDTITDPFGGQADIERKLIRTVGDAEQSFVNDPLRMLRAVRFVSQLGFSLEKVTQAALIRQKAQVVWLSAERKSAELDKVLMGKEVVAALELLQVTGLWTEILPVPCTPQEVKGTLEQRWALLARTPENVLRVAQGLTLVQSSDSSSYITVIIPNSREIL
jgi:tRNA nucleotidyltransferase/poly(A) polymerase